MTHLRVEIVKTKALVFQEGRPVNQWNFSKGTKRFIDRASTLIKMYLENDTY